MDLLVMVQGGNKKKRKTKSVNKEKRAPIHKVYSSARTLTYLLGPILKEAMDNEKR